MPSSLSPLSLLSASLVFVMAVLDIGLGIVGLQAPCGDERLPPVLVAYGALCAFNGCLWLSYETTYGEHIHDMDNLRSRTGTSVFARSLSSLTALAALALFIAATVFTFRIDPGADFELCDRAYYLTLYVFFVVRWVLCCCLGCCGFGYFQIKVQVTRA